MGMMQQAVAPAPEQESGAEDQTELSEEPGKAPEQPEEASDEGGEEATPEEQAEYERAMAGLYDALYKNQKSSQAVLDMVQPSDKIGSTAKAVVLLVQQLDKKLQLDEVVIPQIAQDAAERVVELAEKGKDMEFSEEELQNLIGAVMEGVMQVFGVSPQDAQDFMSSMPQEETAKVKQEYDQMIAKAPSAGGMALDAGAAGAQGAAANLQGPPSEEPVNG